MKLPQPSRTECIVKIREEAIRIDAALEGKIPGLHDCLQEVYELAGEEAEKLGDSICLTGT